MSRNSIKQPNSYVLKGLSADPSSPENGELFYNSTTNKFRFRENGAWKELGGDYSDPMTTIGDLVHRNGSNVTARLPIGTTNYFLRSNGTTPEWAAIPAGDSVSKNINQTAHGFVIGDVLRRTTTDYVKAQANNGTNAEVVGIVSEVIDANNFKLVVNGYLSGLSSLTSGEVYFLSSVSAGAFTVTAPSTNGEIVKPVFIAISATEAFFSNSYLGAEVQPLAPGGDVSASANFANDNRLIRSDGTTKNVQASGVVLSDTDAMSGLTQLDVDNLRLDGNIISSTNSNGNIELDPNGTGNVLVKDAASIRFQDSDNSNYIGIKSPATVSSDYTITLPAAAPATNEFLKYDGSNYTWSPAGSGEATIRAFTQSSHAFAIGDIVRFNGTNWVKAQANSAANSAVFGIVSEIVDANNFKLAMNGYITGLSGLTAGEEYFLSAATAGLLTATEPSGSGEVSKPVGMAVSTTTFIIMIQRGYVNP